MGRRTAPPPGIERVCRHCGETWLQRDGKAPREYCSTTCRQWATGQMRPVDPDEVDPLPVRTRRVRARAVTITCRWCQQQITLAQFPGPAPRYCGAACRHEAENEAAASRMRRMRERRRTAT